MSLYDDTNPAHLDQRDRWRAKSDRYTLSRRGQPGFCAGCGWTRADDQPCRNQDCPA